MHDAIVTLESWPIAGDGFTISRETKTSADVVVVALHRDGMIGYGECVPLKRYGHTQASIKTEIENWLAQSHSWDRRVLIDTMKAGPARFALDTAMWDLEASTHKKNLMEYMRISTTPYGTAFTLSGASPEKMAEIALAHQKFRWLKLKLMGDGADAERLRVIHEAVPDKELIVDANESLTLAMLERLLPIFENCNVVLVEQPLPAAQDEALRDINASIPFAADESCHDMTSLENLRGKYQVVNLKLDKTGGLTHARDMVEIAASMGFGVMVGCMASTSRSILPALGLAEVADFLDLDGALLLEKDRPNSSISYRDGKVFAV